MRPRHLISYLVFLPIVAFVAVAGCGGGSGTISNTIANLLGNNTSSVAGGTTIPLDQVPMTDFAASRATYGTSISPAILSYPNLDGREASIFVAGIGRFTTDFTPAEGLGPYFNQRICLGCHQAAGNFPGGQPTPVSRAQRGSAFTVFGDFSPAAGTFNPLTEFGGPFFHERTCNGAPPQVIPPESVDPFILNAGMVRAIALRSAPPYIARGLMEAIPNNHLLQYDDPTDLDGDGISGRHNENHDDISFVGGSSIVRVARFGVKGGGPALLSFMLGGLCNQISITTPFCPTENTPPNAVGGNFDPVPDPEINEQVVFALRSMVRLIAPPPMGGLGGSPPLTTPEPRANGAIPAAGAALFGVLLNLPGTAIDPGTAATTNGRFDGINLANRGLNCVGCHVPFMTTGISPAEIGGGHLSNKRFPIFSDLLLHDMGAGLSDNVRIASVTGLATSREWRTPPLMGVGLTGPPYFHDARVGIGLSGPTATPTAQRQAIQLHDNLGADTDSEAHNSIQRFRQLTPAQQDSVIAFLLSL